jgi:hypothetical protein
MVVIESDDHRGAGWDEHFDQQRQQLLRGCAGRPCRAVEDAMERAEVGISLAPQDAKRCRHGAPSGGKHDPGKQHQDVRPGRPCKQIEEAREQTHKSRRERIGSMRQAMGVLHRMRRIESVIRNNPVVLRQIESDAASDLASLSGSGHIDGHEQA